MKGRVLVVSKHCTIVTTWRGEMDEEADLALLVSGLLGLSADM